MENLPRPFGMTAHSIKRGELAHAAAAVIEHDLDPRLLAQLGKHAGPLEPPRSTARYIGPRVALINKSAHLTAYIQTGSANGRGIHGLIRREERRRGNFFRGIAFCDAPIIRGWLIRTANAGYRYNR
ncbi:hypothetical protein DQ04_11551010 [Trypanosoma grayi]|uniref:hypothetical protein n=1 Tax=Trypanosoma grayi TaxID=71804 RepID=UPI0004F4B205|nr:hypothetical protein DQ04_11551010 [Trypanosoma grayi]KEG06943.1 hypothetical protein DQ04_11551010 [Trypanosoma grayi]